MAKLKQPTFSEKSRLVRYIQESDRLGGNRAAVAAFEPDRDAKGNELPNNHLSVNALEVESLKQIAAYHRRNWQDDARDVALIDHQVLDYNDAGRKSDANIQYDLAQSLWFFTDQQDKASPAYKHRPVTPNPNNSLGSQSHCGVEFIRAFDEYRATRFARRLAGKGRYHLVKD